MTEIPSCILSQYMWYNKSIQVDKASVHFLAFSGKSINYVSHFFLLTMVPLKNGMNLRENTTYMKVLHTFGIKSSPLCSFLNLYDETPLHIFHECDNVYGQT